MPLTGCLREKENPSEAAGVLGKCRVAGLLEPFFLLGPRTSEINGLCPWTYQVGAGSGGEAEDLSLGRRRHCRVSRVKPFELFCDPLKFAPCSLFEFLKTRISRCGVPGPRAVNSEVPSVRQTKLCRVSVLEVGLRVWQPRCGVRRSVVTLEWLGVWALAPGRVPAPGLPAADPGPLSLSVPQFVHL